jgi:beta-glucanase (GH16 family)
MELIGDQPKTVYGTVHWGTTTEAHLRSGSSYTLPSGKFSQGYHLFSLQWTADSIKWFVDNVVYYSISNGPPFDKRFHMVLNVAVGGDWPGSPDATTIFPQYMMIDYVRVYAKH